VNLRARFSMLGAAAAVASLLAVPLAGAARLGWNEQAKIAGKPVMSYEVASLTFGKTSWSAHVSFRNLTKRSIRVGNEFGVGFWSSRKATDLTEAVGFATATRFSSRPPTKLAPGQGWTGVIGGSGRLDRSRSVYARVIFGPFSDFPGQATPVVWITDHTKALAAAHGKPLAPVPGPVI
jgi:hypothetical protein